MVAELAKQKVLIDDPLTGDSIGRVIGGTLTKTGWKTTDSDCRVIYDAGRIIKRGFIEVKLTGLNPKTQQVWGETGNVKWPHRHHLIHCNTTPGLDHHRNDKMSSGIAVHLYRQSEVRRDFKLMNFRYVRGEFEASVASWTDDATGAHIVWDAKRVYTLRVEWDVEKNETYLRMDGKWMTGLEGVYDPKWGKEAGVKPDTHFLAPQYFCIGSDLTHSIDRITNFPAKFPPYRYETMQGITYSNLRIVSF